VCVWGGGGGRERETETEEEGKHDAKKVFFSDSVDAFNRGGWGG
jgi:hypothetical protein